MIAMRDIRRFARQIAAEFKPRRVILFGSYAYGTPTEDSDVDILVIMPHRRCAAGTSIAIRQRLHPGFPIDVLVRSPSEVRRRLAMNDWFMREVIERGKPLYAAGN